MKSFEVPFQTYSLRCDQGPKSSDVILTLTGPDGHWTTVRTIPLLPKGTQTIKFDIQFPNHAIYFAPGLAPGYVVVTVDSPKGSESIVLPLATIAQLLESVT